jgi:hypothetical protein
MVNSGRKNKKMTSPASKMNISESFNRFYHALLSQFFKKTRLVHFIEWKNPNTGGCLTFYKGDAGEGDYDCVACDKDTPFELDTSLKTIFKCMNTNYPTNDDGNVSTTEISNKELCEHIDWFTKILNENGYEFDHDIEKWERLKREAGF